MSDTCRIAGVAASTGGGQPKATSFAYGHAYQEQQAAKYRNRKTNDWQRRIELAQRLMERHARPRFGGRPAADIVIGDIGCSIGTFAIEFAKLGYRAYGVDFDPMAIDAARRLAAAEGVEPTFLCGDVSDEASGWPALDVALCFDLFEHLHDDELGVLLQALKRRLSPDGCLLFHTFPTQFDELFFGPAWLRWPLLPFAWLPPQAFDRIVKAYASAVDIGLIVARGGTWRELKKRTSHCNPLTTERLADIFTRAGYVLIELESGQLYRAHGWTRGWFARQPISHRNLYGAAVPAARAIGQCLRDTAGRQDAT